MASFVVFDVIDSLNRTSPLRVRITDQAVDATVTTFVTALKNALFGVAKPSLGGYSNVRLEIDGLLVPTAVAAACDVRDNWQMSVQDTALDVFRWGIPARNDLATLITPGSKTLADLSTATWIAVDTALVGGAVKGQNPEDGTDDLTILRGVSSVRSRKRPREGGSR